MVAIYERFWVLYAKILTLLGRHPTQIYAKYIDELLLDCPSDKRAMYKIVLNNSLQRALLEERDAVSGKPQNIIQEVQNIPNNKKWISTVSQALAQLFPRIEPMCSIQPLTGPVGLVFQFIRNSKDHAEVVSRPIEARTRALQCGYSTDMAQDLKSVHGIDLDAELASVVAHEVASELERELLTYAVSESSMERVEYTHIRNTIERLKPTSIHVGMDFSYPFWSETSDGKREAKGVPVIVHDCMLGKDLILLSTRSNPMESGIIYSPYMLLTRKIVDAATFAPKINMMARYGVDKVNPDAYTCLRVSN